MDEHLHVGKKPSGVAAGAVYAAASLQNEKRTQDQVAEAADVSLTTTRKRYKEQLVANGYKIATTDRGDDEVEGGTSRLSLESLPESARGWVIQLATIGITALVVLLVTWTLGQMGILETFEAVRGTDSIEPTAPGLIHLYPLFGAIALAVMAWGLLVNRLQNRRGST